MGYLSSVTLTLALPFDLVLFQVSLLKGEATHPTTQWEEEDGERTRGTAEAPQRVEET